VLLPVPPEQVVAPPPTATAPPSPPRRQNDAFEGQKDYFKIRVNQLFLAAQSKWFVNIDPVVFALTEFQYDGKMRSLPVVVGPTPAAGGQVVPHGMVFRDITVAGPHPFRGGTVSVSIVLGQMPVGSPARDLVRIVERTGKSFSAATSLASYIAIADALLDGVQTVFGLNGTRPLIGWRQEFEQNLGFRAGHWVLVADGANLRPEELWVKGDELHQGASRDAATPVVAADFVLFSIERLPGQRRDDVEALPFYRRYQEALKRAGEREGDSWNKAKAELGVMASEMDLSPDLIWDDKEEIIKEWTARAVAVKERTVKMGGLAKGPAAEGDSFSRILNLP
jgi:hypothetical protein